MNILALETSGYRGSVAALRSGELVRQIVLPTEGGSARSLAPTIHQLLVDLDWCPHDVELVGVTRGPGSFTGLRVGVVTAKSWAYATGCAVVGVDTLEVIANQALDAAEIRQAVVRDHVDLWIALDAGRGEFFAARFAARDGIIRATDNACLIEQGAWIAEISRHEGAKAASGPGLARVRNELPPKVLVCGEKQWEPTASTVGLLAFARFQESGGDNPWTLAPMYVRPSAAEERRAVESVP